MFGYYLEVTNAHRDRVPADYERRQTLAGAERYVTPELKEYEAKVLGAEERMATREAELFVALAQPGGRRDRAGAAHAAACWRGSTCWAGLAQVAEAEPATCGPTLDDGYGLVLRAGRHPVSSG